MRWPAALNPSVRPKSSGLKAQVPSRGDFESPVPSFTLPRATGDVRPHMPSATCRSWIVNATRARAQGVAHHPGNQRALKEQRRLANSGAGQQTRSRQRARILDTTSGRAPAHDKRRAGRGVVLQKSSCHSSAWFLSSPSSSHLPSRGVYSRTTRVLTKFNVRRPAEAASPADGQSKYLSKCAPIVLWPWGTSAVPAIVGAPNRLSLSQGATSSARAQSQFAATSVHTLLPRNRPAQPHAAQECSVGTPGPPCGNL